MRTRKRLLIDLSILKNINCGLGQIALNYARFYEKTYFRTSAGFDLFLLVPSAMVGKFGNEVQYVKSNWCRKHLPFFSKRVDVWHSIHQLSRYRPYGKKTNIILTVHDFNFWYEKDGVKADRYLKKIQARINRANIIICISEFAKKETIRFSTLNGKPIKVIYNGVENFVGSLAEQPAKLPGSRPFFFSIGQIKEKKNFHVLIPLMKYFPDYDLIIAGQDNGQYASFIKNEIDRCGVNNVSLIGEVNHAERVWLYKNCTAFFFPSLLEGFGLPVIEALLFGKPVFSSKETSLQEIGGDRVFFWNNFDTEYMFQVVNDNLESFYENNENSQLNKEYALQFSYEKHLQAYDEIYKAALGLL